MKRIALLVFFFSRIALAQFDKGSQTLPAFTLFSAYANGSCTTATYFAGHTLPLQAFNITAINVAVVASAAGAGTWTVTVSDGTNTCIATFPCVQTGNQPARTFKTNGSGTGCIFAALSALKVATNTAGCTAGGGPTCLNVDVIGNWR